MTDPQPDAPPVRPASQTALGVTMLRAIHQRWDGEPKILSDPIAEHLLDDAWRAIAAEPERVRTPEMMEMRSRILVRSRFAEERLEQAARRGVRQLVVLGAGFDSFAYRQPDWAHRLALYEVDHPASQAEKRRRLEQAGIALPANLTFVAIDFERVSLEQGLKASPVDFTRPALFSCLGVLTYLSREAAMAIFRLVAGFPPGSEIVFTFWSAERTQANPAMAERVAEMGEPWQTYFDPEALQQELRAMGFHRYEALTEAEADRSWFQGRSDGLKAPPSGTVVAAIVGG